MEKSFDKKGGGCVAQRGCVENSAIKMKVKKIKSTWKECSIENTVLYLLGLDNLEGSQCQNLDWKGK